MSKFNLSECCGSHPDNDDVSEDRVLTVKRVKGGLRFREECDKYFDQTLTPVEVRFFIDKLSDMLDEPEPSE